MRILYSNPNKSEKEQGFFETFLSATRNCLNIEKWEKGESPDRILFISNERIGLEITALVREELAAVRTAQIKCLQRAIELAKQKCLPIVEVNVEFRSNRDPIDIDEAATEIVEFVEKNTPDVHGANTWHCYESGLTYSRWINISLGKVGGRARLLDYKFEPIPINWMRNPIDEIQSRIDEKQSKISDYLKNCDKCWLLIGVNEWTAPEAVAVTKELETHIFSGDFQRLFFLRNIEGSVIKLQIGSDT